MPLMLRFSLLVNTEYACVTQTIDQVYTNLTPLLKNSAFPGLLNLPALRARSTYLASLYFYWELSSHVRQAVGVYFR